MENDLEQLLRLVDESGVNVAARLAESAGVSRQAASARLRKAIKDNLVVSEGRGPGVRYKLKDSVNETRKFPRLGLNEDMVWDTFVSPLISDLPSNVRGIWHHGCTEMVNNAIDHSGSAVIGVYVYRNALSTGVLVADFGEGIFTRIQRALGLVDPRLSLLELAKGKFTTDPDNHSGEGIFFTSRMFDHFAIQSGGLYFSHTDSKDDLLLDGKDTEVGTAVTMELENESSRTTTEVFNQFAEPDEFTFAKTIVPVRLAQHEGDALVSRSQAKRLTARFEKFNTVMLDFEGVTEIGQAFADQVFRVFAKAHPETKLVPINMNENVQKMVQRAMIAAQAA